MCSLLLKALSILSHLFCNVEFGLIQLISQTEQSPEVLIFKIEMLFEFQNKANYPNYWVLINAFWIRLIFVSYRFVRYRFVRYKFRFVRYRYPHYFTCSKTSCWRKIVTLRMRRRRLQDMPCLKDVFKTTWRQTNICWDTAEQLRMAVNEVRNTERPTDLVHQKNSLL